MKSKAVDGKATKRTNNKLTKSECTQSEAEMTSQDSPPKSKDDDGLSGAEEKLLQKYDETIRSGLAFFVEVGTALNQINKERLYRKKSNTFEDYCAANYDMSDKYAYRLINASICYEHLKAKLPKGSVLPKNESQLRPLVTRLEQNRWLEAWETILKENDSKNLTSEAVEKVVHGLLGNASQEKPKVQKEEKLLDVPNLKSAITKLTNKVNGVLKNKRAPIDQIRHTLIIIRNELRELSSSFARV